MYPNNGCEMLWFFFPITHCFISRWRGLKLTPSALIFFAHSLWRGSQKTAFSARALARCYWRNTGRNWHWLRSRRRWSQIRRTYAPSASESKSWTRCPDDALNEWLAILHAGPVVRRLMEYLQLLPLCWRDPVWPSGANHYNAPPVQTKKFPLPVG